MRKINTGLLEEIRLMYSTCTYQVDDNDYLIVPKDETHDFLLNFFPVNESILKFYYAQTDSLFTDADFKKMTESGYFGRKEQTLKPYPIVIYGAFFNRLDFYIKILSLSWQKVEERPTLNNNKIEHFEDLFPYFKEYADGFKNGYEGFEEKFINKYLPLFPDKNDFTNKVFEHVTKKIIFQHDWLNTHSGFTTETIADGKKISDTGRIVNAFEDGQTQGYFYKAWKIIFSNNNLFAPLFESYYQNLKPKNKKDKPKLSMRQIALKYAYEGLFIDEAKKDEIAKENGFTSRTSGHKLKQYFDFYNKRNNRKADPDGNLIKLQNKIDLFESVIELIPDEKRSDLETELSILKSHLSKY